MIWCVEDDAGIREIESYALRSAGFETKEFELLRNFLSHPGKVYAREQLFLQVAEGKLEAHEYLNALKTGELYESVAFAEQFAKYKARYAFPEEIEKV